LQAPAARGCLACVNASKGRTSKKISDSRMAAFDPDKLRRRSNPDRLRANEVVGDHAPVAGAEGRPDIDPLQMLRNRRVEAR